MNPSARGTFVQDAADYNSLTTWEVNSADSLQRKQNPIKTASQGNVTESSPKTKPSQGECSKGHMSGAKCFIFWWLTHD